MIRHRSRYIIGLVLSLQIAGCAHAPANTTPQAAVAHYGTDVVNGINAIQNVLVAATDAVPPLVSVVDATPAMDAIRQSLDNANQLSGLLKVYDAATTPADKQNTATQIQAILNSISAALALTTSPALPQSVVSQTSKLVVNVMQTVNLIRSSVKLNP